MEYVPVLARDLVGLAAGAKDGDQESDGDESSLWHDRLGHANVDSIKRLMKNDSVVGLNLRKSKQRVVCTDCIRGKHHKCTMKSKAERSNERGEIIHSDVSGKLAVPSLGSSNYYVTFIDEFSRYINVAPITRKSDVLKRFKKFHKRFERQYDCTIKGLHCDSGGEYIACDDYLADHGIERSDLPPYSPELNSMAERTNRTLTESARSMLYHADMPLQFWAETVACAADIRNRFT